MFMLSPECQRLTGIDSTKEDVVEVHADTVTTSGAPPA
jgi:hypothetical protein